MNVCRFSMFAVFAVMALFSPSSVSAFNCNVLTQKDSSTVQVSGEADFFAAIDLERVGMAAVRKAADARNWPAAKKALLAHMRSRKNPRLFVDRWQKGEYLALVQREFPEKIAGSVSRADKVCNHDFKFEGFHRKFAGPVIWDKTVSDASFVYSCRLSRMLYLGELGQAWWLTGDRKYVRGACELVDSWIESCPMPPEIRRNWVNLKHEPSTMCRVGNPWGQSLEVADRIGSWVSFNEYFVDCDEITPEFYYRFLVSLLEQSRYIYAIENMGFMRGNWPIIECSGLARVMIMFPEFKESADWWKQLEKLFAMQMEKTILPDGVQNERCIGYHNWCYTKFRDVMLLGRLNGASLPAGFARTVELMGLYKEKISYPGRERQPALGDGSSVRWWRAGGEKKVKKSSDYGLLWKLGLDEYKAYIKSQTDTPAYTSVELPDAGLFVMRTGWEPARDMFLLFDCVPRSSAGGHWHQSALSVDLYAFGRPLIVDAGMSGYSHHGYTDYFRRVRAHNTIEFASDDNTLDPKLKRWIRSDGFDLAEGVVPAKWRAKMNRRILFVRGDYWIIEDDVSVPHRHPTIARAYWHLNSRSVVVGGKQVELAVKGDGASRQRWMGGEGKDLSFYTNDPDTGNILMIPDGGEKYVSLSLLADTPCGGHVACYRQDPKPPNKTSLRFTTLMYPFNGAKRPAVSFKDGVVKIGADRVDSYFRNGEQTDGDCALVSRQGGVVGKVLLVGGSFIKGVVRLDGKVDFIIITCNADSVDVKLAGAAKVKWLELPELAGVERITVNGEVRTLSGGIVAGPFREIKPDSNDRKLFWML